MPFPYSGSALKKFLIALYWISLGTPFMCLAIFETVCSLSLSDITFLKSVPGWLKSQFGWLGLCLATNPVTLYG